MKAKPVKRYRFPRYPTKLMIIRDPELLKKSMSIFKLPKKELAGALAIYLSVSGGCWCDMSEPGCVVVLPPAYISEEEALRVIQDEFSNYGVTLSQDSADLNAVELPIEEDAVDLEHNLAVEFISRSDCVELGGGTEEYMYCDFQSVADSLYELIEAENPEINFVALTDPETPDEEYSQERLREQVRHFAEWLKAQGVSGIVFFGGEPLLHKDLIRNIVARARDMEHRGAGRFHFKITTNGVLLDDKFLEFATREDVLVAMSFDGVKEAQDRHRRFPDGSSTFDYLHQKLRMLLEAKPYSSVIAVVNPDTAQHLSESVSLLLDSGCRYLVVSLNYAANWQDKHFRILRREYKRLARLYIEWTRKGRKFYLSPFEVKLSSHINRHCYRKERCELAKRQLSVDPEGYLYPCVQFTRAGPKSQWQIGNVFNGVDEEARSRVHNESESEKEFCRTCAVKDRCNNSCGCLNWQTMGTVNGISPVLCGNEQMLIQIADDIGEALYKKRDPLFINKHYNEAYPVLSMLEDKTTKSSGAG